jgi:hypothetical protein
VEFVDLWLRIQSSLFGDEIPLRPVVEELQKRWGDIVPFDAAADVRRIEHAVGDIQEKVQRLFHTASPGWNLARYQCPDVMFCASSPQALLEGRYLAVLGEVHVGGHTLATNMFASQHPDRSALLAALRSDLADRYVMPKLSPEASSVPIRTQMLDDPASAIEVLFSRGLVPANPETAIPIAELQVVKQDGRLVVRHKRRDWSADLMDVIGDFLFLAAINQFSLVPKARHTPRITIGQLVVQRERWQFEAGEFLEVADEDEANCFFNLRQWWAAQELPSSMFVKVSWEAKPFYVDFESPLLVRMFFKQLRNGMVSDPHGSVVVSEMLPAFDELWLRDGQGRVYTSELRLVAVHRDDLGL